MNIEACMRRLAQRGLILGAVLVSALATPLAAQAQGASGDVLLFPAVVEGSGGNTRLTQRLVTDALRKYLGKIGVGTILYDKNLPAIRRAVLENEKMVKDADAAAGPGGDERKAQKFAEVIGASEYITAEVSDYKFDSKTRTATFNLSVIRANTADNLALGTVAKIQTGVAPADVNPARQEGAAVARAAEVGAEQAIQGLYPRASTMINAPVQTVEKKRSSSSRYALPVFLGGLAALFFSTR